MFARSECYIDRLLKGATVADLPIEHASELKSVPNLKPANRYCSRRNCPREGRWHRRTTALDDLAVQLLLAELRLIFDGLQSIPSRRMRFQKADLQRFASPAAAVPKARREINATLWAVRGMGMLAMMLG